MVARGQPGLSMAAWLVLSLCLLGLGCQRSDGVELRVNGDMFTVSGRWVSKEARDLMPRLQQFLQGNLFNVSSFKCSLSFVNIS